VNLSPRNLLDPDLVDDVARTLRRYDVPPRLLTLEITEGSVMADPARTIDVLLTLRRMGVHLSVDDFGTGYSSLSYLKRLPVDEVKIDKSFVLNMDHDADNSSIVRSIVDLGANLSLDVVAEGIETREVWEQLVGLGCDFGQGYLVSPPMPIDEFLPWLVRRVNRGPGQSTAHDAARLPVSREPQPRSGSRSRLRALP
jgi:EAL domain-containing protein (putative c-di-GMP-specific phosphodiesterase class I)